MLHAAPDSADTTTRSGVSASAFCSALLRVEAAHFVAASLWEKRLGKWSCAKAAPIMRWHLTATPETVKQWLKSKGYPHQWLKPNNSTEPPNERL